MAGNCSHNSCYPEETGCNVEGCRNLSDCRYYGNLDQNQTSEPNQAKSDESNRIPWTGNSLGLIDLTFLTASCKPIVIGITGVASAGKTTFLASLYCLIRHGRAISDYSFAGSITLNGWEDIAWYLSWKENSNIQFPPHTAIVAGRVPGLLHLALRSSKGEKIDLIFTDAPGEWFDHWRNNVNGENAKGAKWIHDNCDAFLLFADCQMLASSERGQAKIQINSVADRLCENLGSRPLGLVWSKSDVAISESTSEQILTHLKQNDIQHLEEFHTSVHEGTDGVFHDAICDSIAWLIDTLRRNSNAVPEIRSLNPNDMFLSRRSVYE